MSSLARAGINDLPQLRDRARGTDGPFGVDLATQDTSVVGIVKSVWHSVTGTGDPDEQQKLWRLIMYRELPGPMIEFRFKIFVNEKVLPYYNEVRYGQ